MTGLDRLREFVAGVSPFTAVCGVTRATYDGEHTEVLGVRLRDFLAEIADQIASDHAVDCHRMGLDHGTVSRVITDMERHVSGVEGMDDSPVARWARELREALGRQCRDGESDGVADSPYDALRPDDREAIAWVRGHGGLDAVKVTENVRLNYRDALNGVCERLGLTDGTGVPDMPEVIWTELDRRLMPEGMEWLVEAWPRFEDEAPVRFGEDAMGFAHKPPFVIDHVTLFDGGESTVCAEADHDSGKVENFVRVLPGGRVKRPAPEDSWERLEEDVAGASCPDVYCTNHRIDASDTSYEWAMARDIVRRAKALAERDR